jgi:hypothetical protein
MPLKSMGATGTGSHSAIASAIHHAVDHGAHIINLSLGSEQSTTTLHAAVRRAQAAGVLVVAAAGNAGVASPFYPAAYTEALGVAASDRVDSRYDWSNYGTWVGVAAPGCNITTGYLPASGSRGYTDFCGTSSAAPLTAGLAGLLASARPGVAGAALTTALQASTVPVPFVASGRVSAMAALAALPLPDSGGGGNGGTGGGFPPPSGGGQVDEPGDSAPVDTATTLTPSATSVPYGSTVEIVGKVSSASGSTQGAMVTLLTRAAGTSAWATLAEQPADHTGTVVFSRRPQHTADYRLRFEGSSVQAASVSDVVTIAVRPRLAATVSTPHVVAGRRATVTGTIEPAGASAVELHRETTSGWRRVATAAADATGKFTLHAKAPVGTSRYRVRAVETTTLAAEDSAAVSVTGERTTIPAARPDAPGDDARNLNGEFIVLRNTGTTPLQLRGWTVRSASTRTTFALPRYRLPAGAKVKIHSGRGRTSRGHVYLGSRQEVWHNRRDTGVVLHPTGAVAARISW